MQTCNHTGVARILSLETFDIEEGRYFFSTEEFLAGGSLGNKLKTQGLMSVPATLVLGAHLIEAVAHIASHDLSEPLRSISGFVQLLARRYEGKLDDEADQFIARTVEGTVRMQTLITDLLSYSEVARTRAPFVEVECGELMETTLETLAASAAEHGTEIVVGELPTVLGNPARLRQLFQNVVGNAVKFSATADVPRVVVRAERDGAFNEFSVSDNGIGIEPQYRERVFRMFQRLNKREDFGGTGIGLPIAHKIVEMHGGRIWADGAADGGTVIRFTLPAVREMS